MHQFHGDLVVNITAVPCIEEFIAMRSPNERCIKLLEESSESDVFSQRLSS